MSTLQHPGKQHSSIKLYLQIAVILAVITIVEVLYPYMTDHIEFLHPFYMPVLGILSLAKFILVVWFYMHLRHDSALLNFIFVFSLVIAVLVVTAMVFLFFYANTFEHI